MVNVGNNSDVADIISNIQFINSFFGDIALDKPLYQNFFLKYSAKFSFLQKKQTSCRYLLQFILVLA
ncbi:hypothetical protein EY688_06875 [Enterococcus casseliflavus]|nr:hypothetical protein [Enterococcus casseliflavus]MBO6368095.1 hypothetical protein [Enterococcus casseliflavus]MRI72039.1 hypothetical protein [Enterococcus casseliflavus]